MLAGDCDCLLLGNFCVLIARLGMKEYFLCGSDFRNETRDKNSNQQAMSICHHSLKAISRPMAE
jgi:hypothetical protein